MPAEPKWEAEFEPDDTFGPRRGWLVPAIMLLAIAAWTGFFGWSISGAAADGVTPAEAVEWTGSWAVPVLLVLACWLLVLRNSRTEARRFGETAALLAAESRRLEERLLTVNRELSLAREFLEAETRSLEALGRTATERLSEHAERLQALVHDNGAEVAAIHGVSATARENMERLRDNLPVIANAAKDVANQIGNAGRTAQDRLAQLADGFARLEQSGEASRDRAQGVRDLIAEALAELEARTTQIEGVVGARFATLREESETVRAELGARETDALAAIIARMDALRRSAEETSSAIREGEEAALAAWQGQVGELRERLSDVLHEIAALDERALEASNEKLTALIAEAERVDRLLAQRDTQFDLRLGQRRTAVNQAEEAALAGLATRLAQFDEELAQRRGQQEEYVTGFAAMGSSLRDQIEDTARRVDELAMRTGEAQANLEISASQFAGALADGGAAIDRTEEAMTRLTHASVRLLELIRESARHSREDLPQAIAGFEQSLATAEGRTGQLRDLLDDALASGSRLDEVLAAAGERSHHTETRLEETLNRVAQTTFGQEAALAGLAGTLSTFEDGHAAAVATMRAELAAALGELEDRSRAVLADLETVQADRVRALATAIADQGAEALDAALRERVSAAIDELSGSAERAGDASREAAAQLRDQLARVNELTANLESRIAHARSQAEEHADNDFSRRVALITESLNSNAIDIGKALSTEVTDIAWSSYLRGDRGVFTRRAVRLLDTTELRDIAQLYGDDLEFREHVSRYIHDFEAMLRSLLSTRDGHALGVTVLSSDMGKLYVALAQAIERLRE